MCKVFVRDASNKEVMVKELYEGDHFGEIAIIYKCRRTATVQSMNYNTFAVMTPLAYRRLIQDFPEYEVCLKMYIMSQYNDPRIKFVAEVIKRIDYMNDVPSDIFFDLCFSLEEKFFEKGQVVLE